MSAVICPAVLASDTHRFREQMERIAAFAKRIQIDFTDGVFAKSPTISLQHAWWPEAAKADLHLMYQNPARVLQHVLKLRPHMAIVHAEAEGDFVLLAKSLRSHGIKAGVALLPKTPVSILSSATEYIDHILIFSGDLGHFGGRADMSLLGKVSEAKALAPGIEIGWDGGINAENAKTLIKNGVDVLNSGGFIQNAEQPQEAYATLERIAREA